MNKKESFSVRRYLRDLPLPFCKGCGIFTVMHVFLKAVYELNFRDLKNFVFCSGIGCSSWIPSPYFKADSIHTPHGRSIPVATGVRLVNSDINIVVFGGDGDLLGIGLSHLIHASRRNLSILTIMVNNMIYGMTGGQLAPTTLPGMKSTTSVKGRDIIKQGYPIRVCELLAGVDGAFYLERCAVDTPKNIIKTKKALKKAFKNQIDAKGFSLIEILSMCPTGWGVSPVQAKKWTAEVMAQYYPLGVYRD